MNAQEIRDYKTFHRCDVRIVCFMIEVLYPKIVGISRDLYRSWFLCVGHETKYSGHIVWPTWQHVC